MTTLTQPEDLEVIEWIEQELLWKNVSVGARVERLNKYIGS